jgi:AraC-like DNA-binding protein
MTEVMDHESLETDIALDQAGLSRHMLTDPHCVVSGLQELAFQRAFIMQTAMRPDLWVLTGLKYRWLHYGMGGLAAATAPTLHAFSQTLHDWKHLTYSLKSSELKRENDLNVGFEYDLSGVPESLREFTVYRDLGAGVTFYKDILLVDNTLERIEIAGPDPHIPGLAAMLGTKALVFDAGSSGYFWGAENARKRLPNSDPILHLDYLSQCRKTAETIAGAGSFLEAAVECFQRADEPHTIETLAKQLNVSQRTLQRRLGDHGMTFHDLRRGLFMRRAREMLRSTKMSIAEIAWSIGYSDPTSFAHAFRRWTGMSPRAFRSGGKHI